MIKLVAKYIGNWIRYSSDNYRKNFSIVKIDKNLEARAGIEPTYKDLQSSA